MNPKVTNFIAMDIGSSKIAALGAFIDKNGDAQIVGQNLHYSDGIRSSVVTDLHLAENSILQAVYTLEQECDTNINAAVISLSGYGTKSYFLENSTKINADKITATDVQKLVQKTLGNFNIKDHDVIHYFPIEFVLDDDNVVDDPVGMFSNILECKLHVIGVSSNILKNLANCLAKCQIEISGVVLGIYASGIACLTDDEKNLGSLVIDLGSRTTSFGIFLGGKMVYSGYIPFGGWHITSDIAKAFSTSLANAEKLKVLYGSATNLPLGSSSVISLDDEDGNEITITSADLAEIIGPRIQEILDLLKSQYDKIGIDYLISRRIVLTGGGSILKGLKEMVSTTFQKQTRTGKPKVFHGFSEDYNPGIYSTSVGLLETYVNRQRKNYNPALDDFSTKQSVSRKILAWLKQNL